MIREVILRRVFPWRNSELLGSNGSQFMGTDPIALGPNDKVNFLARNVQARNHA